MLGTKTLLTILLLTLGASATCGNGCRKCNASGKCLFCDVTQGYVLEGVSCAQIEIINCDEITVDGKCKACDAGFFLAFASEICLAVSKPIDNCRNYANEHVCATCNSGFVVTNSKCVASQISIENCADYNVKGLCSHCQVGFVPTTDGLSCKLDPLKSNCAIYTNLQCNKCKPGYVLNPNYYYDLYYKLDNSSLDSTFMDIIMMRSKNKLYSDLLGPCQPISLKDCLVIDTADRCKVCKDGFYLDEDKRCRQNPYPVIPFCTVYSSNTVCTGCTEGYHLKSINECEVDVVIEKCLKYANNKFATTCSICETGYYLADNTCVPRDMSLTLKNCSLLDIEADTCKICDLGFVRAQNGYLCKSEILNCQEYNSLLVNEEQSLICQKCNPGFYLDISKNFCVEGMVPYCEIYDRVSNICVKCEFEFYKNGDNCQKHETISACDSYSNDLPNICESCLNNHFLLTSTRVCRPLVNILYCAEYETFDQCKTCMADYYLLDNNCEPISPLEHCVKKSSPDVCVKCLPEYLLQNGECVLSYQAQRDHCIKFDESGTNPNFECEKCQYNYYPFNYTNLNFCLTEETIEGFIPLCMKHTVDPPTGGIICTMCRDYYVVSSDYKRCDTECLPDETVVITEYLNLSTSILSVNNMGSKICMPSVDDLANCEVGTSYNPKTYACLKCRSPAVPSYVTSYDKKVSLFNGHDPVSAVPTSIGFAKMFVQCLLPEPSSVYYPGNTKPNKDCEFYKKQGGNFYCQKCVFGKTGPAVTISPPISLSTNTYVDCLYEVVGCDTSNIGKYGALHLNNISIDIFSINPLLTFTCYKCNSAYEIPVAHISNNINAGDVEKLQPYGLEAGSTKPSEASDLSGHQTVCRAINSDSLKIPDASFTAKWISNCALAWYDTSITKNYTLPHSMSASIKCLECAPGYRKVTNADGFVISCDQIKNCSPTHYENWMNACADCNFNYAWRFNHTTGMIDFDFCIPVDVDYNCMAIAQVDLRSLSSFITHPSKYCRYCKKGYGFNKDGICERITSPRCVVANFADTRNIDFFQMANNQHYNYLAEYLAPRGDGCSQCETGYMGVVIGSSHTTLGCTFSPYLANRLLNTSTSYVPNCRHYSALNEVPACDVCEVGYILSTTRSKCVLERGYPMCKYVDVDKALCQTCMDGFVLVNSVCQAKNIPNCMVYKSNAKFVQCEQCENTYQLSGLMKCERGTIAGCEVYSSDGKCASCSPFHVPVNRNGVLAFCLAIKEDLNCMYADGNKLISSNQYACTKCIDGYSFDDNVQDLEKTFCLKSITIPNCITYDLENVLSNADLGCEVCRSDYYASAGACIKRTVIENCISNEYLTDTCEFCDAQYFLSSDKKSCKPYPTGTTSCAVYSNATTCERCISLLNLKGGKCLTLQLSQYVDNCEFYKDSLCIGCRSPYALFSDSPKCQLMIAKNCKTALSPNECETCPDGFVLDAKSTANVINCIQYKRPYCIVTDQKTPYKCLKCLDGYFALQDGCSPVNKLITGCISYSTARTCSACQESYVLSDKGDLCTPSDQAGYSLFNDCEVIQYVAELQCASCEMGYYFESGVCVGCPDSVVAEGCQACDYTENNTCLVCREDYYQDSFGSCVFSNIESPVDSIGLMRAVVTAALVMIGLLTI